jgi:predicted heme/steroid binding protein
MLAVVFWDDLENFMHHGHASGGDSENCPYIQLTNQPGADIPTNADGSAHNAMAALDTLPPLNQVLPRHALPAMAVEELSLYDGSVPGLPLLIAVDGYVVNVSSSEKVYGKGGAYSVLAGRAATRAIALSSLDENDLNDDLSDLDEEQMKQKEKFRQALRAVSDIETFAGLQRAVESELKTAWRDSMTNGQENIPTMSLEQVSALGVEFVIVDGWVFDVSTDALGWWYGAASGYRNSLQGKDVTSHAIAMDENEALRVSAAWEGGDGGEVDLMTVVKQWALAAYLRIAPVLAKLSDSASSASTRDEL